MKTSSRSSTPRSKLSARRRSQARREVVLLLTHSADYFTVDRVADELRRRGATPFRLDTDLFPARVRLSAESQTREACHTITAQRKQIAGNQIRAVWARKIWRPQLDDDLDADFHEVCVNESLAALDGFLDGLRGAHWVNDPAREREAENKLFQLRIAREVGLMVPRTLMTNDPTQARRFFRKVNGQMVAKLLRPVSMSMSGTSPFVYTSCVTRRDLADAGLLRHSPMLFQELIPKHRELRVVMVGDQVFAGSIETGASARGQIDWRLAAPAEVSWQPAAVPRQTARRLARLMSRLGLIYGAIDLIETPTGELIFLEVNPGGEWGMLERDLGHPISGALADVLLA
jgi:MvdC family ATP-grasp ribosomal peptide maturase